MAKLLVERNASELLYLESKWALLMSYGLKADLLADVLPMTTSTQSVINNATSTTQRMEDELGEEQFMFAQGCLAEWARLPPPDGRITVGIDGGYVPAVSNLAPGFWESRCVGLRGLGLSKVTIYKGCVSFQ